MALAWPPLRDIAELVERFGITVLVSAALFQLLSGILNVARWYAPMPFFFTAAHYWVAGGVGNGSASHRRARRTRCRKPVRGPSTSAPAVGECS